MRRTVGGEQAHQREPGSAPSRVDAGGRDEAADTRPSGAPAVVLFTVEPGAGRSPGVAVAAANRVALELLTCEESALADRGLDELFPPGAALALLPYVQRAAGADEPVLADIDLTLPGGRLTGTATFTPLLDGPGGRVKVAMVASTAEADLAESSGASARAGLFRIEAGLGNVFVDEHLTAILGVTHDQALGHGWLDGIAPDDRDRVERALRAAQVRGEPLDLRFRFRRPDGEERAARLRAVPLLGDAGTAPGFLGTLEDVTERQAAERAVRRYASTFELTTDIVTFHDASGEIIHLNPAAREFFGVEGDTVPPLNIAKVVATDISFDEFARAFATEGRWSGEVELRGAKGRRMLASIVVMEQRDADGERDCYAAIARDITEQRAAERILRSREAWFESLFRNAPDLVAVHASDGTAVYISPSVARILGYTPEEYTAIKVLEHVHPDDRRTFLDATSRMMAQPGGVVNYEGRVFHRDGSTRVLESTMTNLLDDPDVRGAVINSRDVTERRESERARRRTEATLRAIVQHSPLAIFVLDEHGRVRMWNRACERLLGWASEEVLDRPLPFLVPGDELSDLVTEVVQGERVESFEIRRARKDGQEIDLDLSVSPLRDQSERVIAVVGVAADVSDRRQAEAALRGSEERFRLLVQHSSDLTLVLDPQFRLTYASPSVADFFDLLPEELVGNPLPATGNVEERARVAEKLRELMLEPGGVRRFDFLQPRRDGEPHYLEIVATNLVDEPSIGGIVLNCRDVTERVFAEEQLRERELLMRFLVESASDVLTIVEADGTVRYASPVARRLFGYQPEAGASIFELIHPDDAPDALRHWQEGRHQPGIYQPVEVRLLRADGTYFYAEVIGNNLLDDPTVRASVMTIRDVTERRAAEEALRQSEQRFGALIRNLNEAITVFGPDHALLYQSPAAARMLGTTETGTGMPPESDFDQSLIHPDDHERVVSTFDSAWDAPGTVGPIEYRVRRSDGQWIRVEGTAQNLLDDPAVGGVVITLHDVTARREAEEALRESETRYRAIVEDQTELIARFRRDGTVTFVNDALSRFAGAPAEVIVGRNFFDFSPMEKRHGNEVWSNLAGLTSERPTENIEYKLVFPDGRVQWAQWTTRAIFDRDGEVVEYQAVGRDVTDRRRAELLTERQAEILELIARGVPLEDTLAAIVRTVEEHSPLLRAVVALFDSESGRLRAAAAPSLPLRYVEAIDGAVVSPQGGTCANAVLRREQVVTTDIATDSCWDDHRDDALAVGLRACWATPLMASPDGDVLGVLGVYAPEPSEPTPEQRQIAAICSHLASIAVERKRFEDQLSHQSLHDPLTGLPNRSLFLDRLAHALERARRTHTEVAVLFLDLDRFKLVNDSLGHDVGDELLVTTARRLVTAVRPGDTVARFGGDEFTVLCEDLPEQTADERAAEIAERLFGAISAPYLLGDTETFLTASIGIAMASDTETRPEDLLRDADAAMYHAKESGKGRWEVFDDAMRDRVLARHATENALHRAIERGELRMFLQPLVSLDDGRCIGAEALVRWQHPEQGLVPPGLFIPLAEETGLIVDLGYWIFEEAARQAARWQIERGDPLVVSVNLSGRQLAQPDLPARLSEIIERTGVDPSRLCLEITESVLMDDAEATMEAIQRVRALGLGFSIDDFGTGYSSLGYLKRFPIDTIKIDRSFVSGLATEAGDAAIVSAVIGLGHALGLHVLAEGVETPEQLTELVRLGCDQAQGYLFAPPQPVDDIRRLLGREHRFRAGTTAVADARRRLPHRP